MTVRVVNGITVPARADGKPVQSDRNKDAQQAPPVTPAPKPSPLTDATVLAFTSVQSSRNAAAALPPLQSFPEAREAADELAERIREDDDECDAHEALDVNAVRGHLSHSH